MRTVVESFFKSYVGNILSAEYLYKYHINTFPYPIKHGHLDYWEFTIITEGSIIENINNKKKVRKSLDIFFAGPGDVHSLELNGEDSVRYITISIEEKTFLCLVEAISPTLLSKIKKKDNLVLTSSLINDIENIIHRLNCSDRRNIAAWNDRLCCAVLLVLQNILYQSSSNNDTTNIESWHFKLYQVLDELDAPLYKVSDLCKKLNYSYVHLNRLFQRDFNMSPHDYLLSFRLNYAANLLQHSTKSIQQIASDIGFQNISQFDNSFKEKYGITPKEYRKTM